MTYSDLLKLDIAGKTVVIIGCPASGKTTLGKALAERTGRDVIHTDDYMEHGYKQSMYAVLADLMMRDENTAPPIIEGVQGYRLLRKGVELDCFYPDVVIELHVTPEQVARVYREQRSEKKAGSLIAFNKMHETILADYRAMDNPRPPAWYTVQNDSF